MSALEVVAQALKAIEDGNISRVRELYSPTASVWYNHAPDEEVPVGSILAMLQAVTEAVPDLRFDVRRKFEVQGGVFQEHTVRGTLPSGESLALEIAAFFEVSDGQIIRLEEYFDLPTALPLLSMAPTP